MLLCPYRKRILLVVHGDDFTVLGFESQPISKRDGLIALQDFTGIIINHNSDASVARNDV